MKEHLRRRLVDPLKAQLLQGVSPAKLALALSLGLVLGVTPLLGVTTALCAVTAVTLRLNQPAIQLANYAAYPLQLILFVPFFQGGARLFGRPALTLDLTQLRAELGSDLFGTIGHYLGDNLRALAAWGLLAPVVAVLLFLALRAVLVRVKS